MEGDATPLSHRGPTHQTRRISRRGPGTMGTSQVGLWPVRQISRGVSKHRITARGETSSSFQVAFVLLLELGS